MTDPISEHGTFDSMNTVSTATIAVPSRARAIAVSLAAAIVFAFLTFVGASIRIPLFPVPVTLQTLFVILAGAMLGSRVGALSQLIYLGLGGMGLPIFAGSLAGFAVFASPTGGYLAGFLFAAVIVGILIDKKSTLLWHVTVFAIGSVVILLAGVVYLAVVYTHDLSTALAVGFVPFLLGDAVKVLAAASIYRSYTGYRRNRILQTRS